MATCSASLSSMGLSGASVGAGAAKPAKACCNVYWARTGMALSLDWNVGISMRASGFLRDFPSCENKLKTDRTSSSATEKVVPSVTVVAGNLDSGAPGTSVLNNAEADRHRPDRGSVPELWFPEPVPF